MSKCGSKIYCLELTPNVYSSSKPMIAKGHCLERVTFENLKKNIMKFKDTVSYKMMRLLAATRHEIPVHENTDWPCGFDHSYQTKPVICRLEQVDWPCGEFPGMDHSFQTNPFYLVHDQTPSF
jgi:hypothetical protein